MQELSIDEKHPRITAMNRYFFDIANRSQSIYDHKGRELSTPEAAYQLAELIALDLEVEGEWTGWAVAVRTARGEKYFSVPVREQELSAA
jgi:hypothetical protein